MLQPQRAVLLEGLPRCPEPLDRLLDPPRRVERALEVVVVEANAERLQVPILLLPELRDREAADRLDVAEVVADFVEVALRELADVLTVVAVLGKGGVLAQDFLRARADRDREVLDLLACVVVVELARDRRALPLEQRRHRVTERGLAAVADVQRACRIRGDELDDHPLARARARPAVALALFEYSRDHGSARGWREEQVDETGARDLGLRHELRGRQRSNERLRQFARIALERLRVLERDVGRIVAVRGLLRSLDDDRNTGALGSDRGQASCKPVCKLSGKISHGESRNLIFRIGIRITKTANQAARRAASIRGDSPSPRAR